MVAASGGADSTALALALQQMGCEMALAHVHHGIRGKTATADSRFVATLAKKWKIPFFLGKFDVPAEAKKSGESLEMAARRVRRDFLLATARREKFSFIATGHTADDQAETVLMRIVRGTSISGLAGIAYSAKQGRVTIVRPLRDATRSQIVAFLRQRKQRWREDETNAKDFAMRNRVRHEILPLLEKRLNPAVRQALLRLADIAAAEEEVMSKLAQKTPRNPQAPLAIRRRHALADLRAAGVPPEKQVFHSVETFFPLCGKIAKKFSIVWKNGGAGDVAPQVNIRKGRGFSRRADEVCLSAAAVAGRDLVLRSWREGDRMKPLGMTGSKKLSDIFTDLKVPRAERNGRVVVECGGEVAALAGWRVSRDFAVEGPRAESIRICLQAMTPRERSSK